MAKVLTAAAVAKIRPGAGRIEVGDGGAQGLRLVVQPSGAKSWAVRFRRPDGRPGKLTLGPTDLSGRPPEDEPVIGTPLTLAEARALAAAVERQRARKRDPIADRAAEKAAERAKRAETFGAAARAFVEQHAQKRQRRWVETARYLGLRDDGAGGLEEIPGGLAVRWREKPVGEVDGHDIYAVVDEARRLGIPGLKRRNEGSSDERARAVRAALSKMFAWMLGKRMVSANPVAGVVPPEVAKPRERVLSSDEVRWFWSACGELGEPFGPLLKLLLLTGARREEVAQMTRSELGNEGMAYGTTWTLAGSRTKNGRAHVVPLPPLARDILAGVRQIAGKPGYVFTTNGRSPVSGFSKTKQRIDRAMLAAARAERPGGDVEPWTVHDLRRTAATGMAELGIAPHIVEACLNHVSGARAGVAGTYNRALYAEEKRVALERWANHVAGLVEGRSAKVVPLRA